MAKSPTVECAFCHREIDRSKGQRAFYIYPVARQPVDLRAGVDACATCAPEQHRLQEEMGLVVPIGAPPRASLVLEE